jgi:hypothetical protein
VIDLLCPVFRRLEFTRECTSALLANTPSEMVSRWVFYNDQGDEDCLTHLREVGDRAWCQSEIHHSAFGSPVAIMKDYLSLPGADIFAKIDNDVIVPPGWLTACLAVMAAHPELDLLGIEPPLSRTRPPGISGPRLIDPAELEPGPLRYVRCRSIGGIGLMRRRAFERFPDLRAEGTYGGFTGWQQRHPELVIGWIAPPLNVFLLDRMPVEPWLSLSARYMAMGWQRPWTNYDPNDHQLWDWWTPAWPLERETIGCPA